MAIATCRMFAEPVVHEYIDSIILPNKEVPITYIDQAIPSPFRMLMYEEIELWSASTLNSEHLMTFEESIDITGARVDSYYGACRLILMVQRSKRLIPFSMVRAHGYSSDEHNAMLIDLKIPSRLQPNYH